MMFQHLVRSLPLQLVFHHLKKNLALIALWVLIIGCFSGGIGKVYGIHYLFLDPEYLGQVGFRSFFIIGIAFGNFTIAFHITSYILDSHQFRFIGVLQRPFTKYSLNNSLIPLITLAAYLLTMVNFQMHNEFANTADIVLYAVALIAGIVLMHILMLFYFRFTNKDIFKYLSGSVDKTLKKNQLSRGRVMDKLKENREDRYRVETYFDLKLRLRSTEAIMDFRNKEALLKVFDQNHFNSVVVELIIIGVILILGFFMDVTFLQIPAAASCLLIFSIAMMLIGAISYWFRGWSPAFAVALFIVANVAVKNGLGKGIHEATGLNYQTQKTPYTIENLLRVHSKEQFMQDQQHMLQTLGAWERKQQDATKQKMVLLCISGGGQRAALWTVNSLLAIDSTLNGELMDRTFMITGASGGLIGAAYYREMFLRNPGLNDKKNAELIRNMGKDNLNPVIFSLLVNDLFFKLQSYEFEGTRYKVDRGYIFEQNLNKNLGNVLDKKVMDYYDDEVSAKIPILLMSPTISNDGRKLYISSQPMSFMTVSTGILGDEKDLKIRGADFMTFFKRNGAENLHFLSALRMSASFPYITPNISLPSDPGIEIMDAGISDNFGVTDALRFIHVFKDWIAEHTDGILLIVIRDTKSNAEIKQKPNPSILDRGTYPIASVYNNLGTMQDVKNDARLERAKDWFPGSFDIVEITYDSDHHESGTSEEERASLNWHLTTKEKRNLLENIKIRSNRQSLARIKNLLTP